MGPWLFLVSTCFRENVVATCKIGSFLCSLDNLLQKNVIVLFFGNQISKEWRSFEKGLFLTYFSHFLVTREKVTKIPSAHISVTYIHVFCLCICVLYVYYTICICTYSNVKFIVICKPRTLNDGGGDSVKYRI